MRGPLAHPAGLFSVNLGKPARAYCACEKFGVVVSQVLAAHWLADRLPGFRWEWRA